MTHLGYLTKLSLAITIIFSVFITQCQTAKLNSTVTSTEDSYKCKEGVFIPKWTPSENISLSDRLCRAAVYFISLAYLFLGVSIIADRFMSSIEVITSKERKVVVTKPGGETVTINVRIWNETVSNLTLMALGSSAPEILLTAIEVAGNDFMAGELGPGTIVGSAAFNLFVIISICIYVIPNNEVRKIKHLRVFLVTATWSLLAYLWMYIIIAQISPGVIEIWEGFVTLALFPITVFTAYVADKKLMTKHISRAYRASRHHGVVIETEGESDIEMGSRKAHLNGHTGEAAVHLLHADAYEVMVADGQDVSEEILLFEQHRKEYMEILTDLRKKNPNIGMKSLQEMAEYEVLNRGPKSRAFYRIQATRLLTGGGNVIKKRLEKDRLNEQEELETESEITKVHFEPAHYTVMENVGSLSVTVRRKYGNLNKTVSVDYKTQDGTAHAGSDYHHTKGTVTFQPGETEKSFQIDIIDDDIFEEDEHFFIKLANLQVINDGADTESVDNCDSKVILGTPAVATIMILDDDHAGIVNFDESVHDTFESVGECHVKVTRSSGARGHIIVPFTTKGGTAKAGLDYEAVTNGELEFSNDEFEKYITIKIIDSETYEKNVFFTVALENPILVKTATGDPISNDLQIPKDPNDMTEDERVAELGKPKLGDKSVVTIQIGVSPDFKKTVDKVMSKTQGGFLLGTSSWREQFKEAISVSAECSGDAADSDACDSEYGQLADDNSDNALDTEEERQPSCGDYIMHYISLFWKVLFATVPPTEYIGGWGCFVISIVWIGILTGIISDLASSFGCTIRLKDSVTAISFVALGTSVPDTFASKVAAIGDKYADSSIGNVTGSNAVNVFLGIGVAWTMAAIVSAARGTPFVMKAGSLAFSLTVYFIFALLAITVILVRGSKTVGGELGGPMKYKVPSSIFLALLWVTYVIVCSLEAYGYIKGF